MKKIILKFEEWLLDQKHREDLIGDLARVPGMQMIDPSISNRKLNEHKGWVDTVIRLEQPGFIYIFNDAWQEFLLAKKEADDSPN